MKDPTDAPPPPSYQMSVEEFDQKTSRAMQLASSSAYPVGEDGWQIYDPAAFDAATESDEHPPSSSSSAGFPGVEANRQVRLGRPSSEKTKHSTRHTKASSSERHSLPEDEFASEARSASPPPPFTATGPSLDGPPFEEVVTLSYHGPDSSESYPSSPRSPPQAPVMLQPVEPLRFRPNRTSRHPSHQQITPRPNLPSGIARVEFDPQMAYSPYGGMGNHTSVREGALAFYNHAVASQLMASPNMTAQTQSGHMERPSSGYTSTSYWGDQAIPSVSPHEQYTPHVQSFHSGAPAVPPPPPPPPHLQQSTGVGYTRSSPSGIVRGPLPPVPPQPRWAGSETQIVQNIYGGRG